MADPATWAIIAGVAAVGSAVVSASGAISRGNAQQDAANYQAQIARNNAISAERNAQYATEAGAEQGLIQSMKGASKLAAIKTKQAANGVDINRGSAVDVREGEAEGSQLDVQTIQHNALLKAYGYRTQAVSDEAQAGLDVKEGAADVTASRYEAVGGLLGAASSVAGKWGSSIGGGGGGTDGGLYANESGDPGQGLY